MKKFENVVANEKSPKWENMIKREKKLSEKSGDIRTYFERDYTRVLYSTAYRRLKHKNQIYFSPKSDHICTRIEHVNYVESISYTIANTLGLNTELTKAISIAHDLGHSPFGHQGEKVLNEISKREIGETFWHEKNGLNAVDNLILLENHNGDRINLNLTYAVRDGIPGHCGNPNPNGQKPREEFIDLKEFTFSNKFAPYTWEACVVKIADNISYLGRDLEDAKEMKIITDRDIYSIDKSIENIRVNNSSIIGYLIGDLCNNSTIAEGLKFSEEAYNTMEKIKKFNNEKIYQNEKIQPTKRYFKVVMNEIFYALKNAYNGTATVKNIRKMKRYYPYLSEEFSNWLETYSNSIDRDNDNLCNKVIYDLNDINNYSRAIIDYMSGMTDQYIVRIYNEIVSF